jgi:16S rRNA (guanine527-N7)-methyltransferase
MIFLDPERRARLTSTLVASRELGFLGPAPVEQQMSHSLAFAEVWSAARSAPPTSLLDLGSGGGVPGLVLAELWPTANLFLLEAHHRRADFLRKALDGSSREGSSSVLEDRAELVAHGPLRGTMDLVTARSFAPPPVVAECAVGFLQRGALLLVSDPPSPSPARWPQEQLAQLGLRRLGYFAESASVVCLERSATELPSSVPRRVGVPKKRPLWSAN